MNKTIVTLCTALLLTACFGGESSSGSADCFKEYWDGTLGVCLPKGWIVIDAETLRQRGVPDDTVVGFQSEDSVSGQFPTVAVTREALAEVLESTDYSDANIRAVTVMPGYEFVDGLETRIDNNPVKLHIFRAQPIADEPVRRYYQISTVVEKNGYTITATVPVSIGDDVEKVIMGIVQSLTFTDVVVTEEEEG